MTTFFEKLRRPRTFFWLMLVLGVFLIFFRLTRADLISDDAHYSFRALDYVDFVSSQNQTTPLQWFGELPWWSRLSFHDAPPLVFFIQHVFFKFLGPNVFAARVPFAFAGVLSLILTYALARRLYHERAALFAMVLLATQNYFIWSSRIGYLEAIAMTCILAALYFLVKSASHQRLIYWCGFFLGLSMLSKYTTFFLIPTLIVYLWLERRQYMQKMGFRKVVISALIALVLFSPVIVYNIFMFKTRGHFDMQFAILFGHNMSDWSNISRTVSLSFFHNLIQLIRTLTSALSLSALLVGAFSVAYVVYEALRRKVRTHRILLLSLFFLSLQFVFISSSDRYLSLYVPLLALSVGYCFALLYERFSEKRGIRVAIILLFTLYVMYQMLFTINTNHTMVPFGITPHAYSPIRVESRGYNQLDAYLADLLRNVKPAQPMVFEAYRPLPGTLDDMKQRLSNTELRWFHSVIVYDENLLWFGRFWALEKWMKLTYVPVMSFENALLQGRDFKKYYLATGVDSAYIVVPTALNRSETEKLQYPDRARLLKRYVHENDIQPVHIVTNASGVAAFEIYFINHLWETLDKIYTL